MTGIFRAGNGELSEYLSELGGHNFASKVIDRINSCSMRINFMILNFQRTLPLDIIYLCCEFIQNLFHCVLQSLYSFIAMLYLNIYLKSTVVRLKFCKANLSYFFTCIKTKAQKSIKVFYCICLTTKLFIFEL